MKCGMRSEICHKICKKINELYYFIHKKYIIHIMGALGHLIYSLLFIFISSFASIDLSFIDILWN